MNDKQAYRKRYLRTCRVLIVVCILTALFYLQWLFVAARPENMYLFVLLLCAESFNVAQAAGFWYTVWIQRWNEPADVDFSTTTETVDAFVTVCHEPAGIVEETVAAVAAIDHPRLTVWVLDDGSDPAVAAVAERHGARYLTRKDRTGAKAGNINNALKHACGDFVIIFDADQVPVPTFLTRTMGCFADPRIAFVQTPQAYRNRDVNRVAAGAHEQQALFYGPIQRGRDTAGAIFSCGTNIVFRRTAIDQAGGVPEDSITEDLRLSLVLLHLGWKSTYLPETLAEGLGPTDVRSFFSQQRRWARGGLEILFHRHPFDRRMTFRQLVEYALGFLYWFNGWAYSVYITLTLAFLFFGVRPVQVQSEYPAHFLPYVLATLVTMVYATEYSLTFRALWFTLGSFPVHIGAFFTALFGRRHSFVVTPKSGAERSFAPVTLQLLVAATLVVAISVAVLMRGVIPSVMNNVAFAIGHVVIVSGFIWLAVRPERSRAAAEARRAEPAEALPEAVAGVAELEQEGVE